jgi:quinoprotein glucose dehydrogenase
LEGGSNVEKQAAFAGLGKLNDARVDALIARWLERLGAGAVEPALQLDLLEAAAARRDAQVQDQLARVEARFAEQDPLDAFAFALEGGDAAAGQDIFMNKTSVSCSRCHGIVPDDKRVGPSLAGIGGKKSRRELLESLLLPNKTIAEGFATVVLTLDTGKTVTGIILEEANGALRLVDDQTNEFTVSADAIEDRYQGQSAMPDDVARHLTRREIRDLVEFLANLRE